MTLTTTEEKSPNLLNVEGSKSSKPLAAFGVLGAIKYLKLCSCDISSESIDDVK